jgi:hypothetical protein
VLKISKFAKLKKNSKEEFGFAEATRVAVCKKFRKIPNRLERLLVAFFVSSVRLCRDESCRIVTHMQAAKRMATTTPRLVPLRQSTQSPANLISKQHQGKQ